MKVTHALTVLCSLWVSIAPARAQAEPSASAQPPLRGSLEFPIDFEFAAQVRAAIAAGASDHDAPLRRLRRDAEKLLSAGPYSVTEKQTLPPSGDPHDFMSVGPYWWPDPDKPDGLPYIRRDGETNPERRKIPDAAHFSRVATHSHTLATAGYFLSAKPGADHAQFTERAALLLRVWFVDEATKMNPHLRFGQAIPGRVDGRDIGIIDTRKLHLVTDTLRLLDGQAGWTTEDAAGMRGWLRAYYTWLTESEFGKSEGRRKNNHATYYDVQVVALAEFLGERAAMRERLAAVGPKHIATHVSPSGEQKRETSRANGWAYSVANLRGFCVLAEYGDRCGVDLWNFETADGRSVRRAFDYLAPHLRSLDSWPHGKLNNRGIAGAQLLFHVAAACDSEAVSAEVLEALPPLSADHRLRLTLPIGR